MDNQKDMIKGFNNGYMLEKHNPELARKLLNGFTDKEHPYVQGFTSGVREFARERIVQQMRERNQSRDRNIDRELDR